MIGIILFLLQKKSMITTACKRLIQDMCKMSALVYHDPDTMQTLFDQQQEPVLQRFSESPSFFESPGLNDCEVYVGLYTPEGGEKGCCVAFRGTEGFRDWLSDFNVVRVPMDVPNTHIKPLVHYGFLRQYRSVEEPLIAKVRELKEKHQVSTIYMTGHSLGSFLSTIAAVQLKHHFQDMRIHCITFGSPRGGDETFCNMFDECVDMSYRFCNCYDPVTATPFSFRFQHVRGEQWIYGNSIEQQGRFSHVSRVGRILWHGIKSLCGYTDISTSTFHSITKYYEDIEKYL